MTSMQGTTTPPADGGRRTRRLDAVVITVAAVATIGFAAVATLAAFDASDTSRPATTTPSASPVRPPADQIQPVHNALHDIDARCGRKAATISDQAQLQRDADGVVAFARRYPDARFPIDDESGTTLSLLLVTRQGLLTCAPEAAATVNQALPAEFRTPASTAGDNTSSGLSFVDTPGFSRGRKRSSCGAGQEEPVRRRGGAAFAGWRPTAVAHAGVDNV
ncbi:hypothetical protein [Streptomyces sp. NPDC005799]|uniref:hypothetical protein n=1 Tax=Streptomyces sp. NPDC005799 TaxID=3154678 RepID=UPI0033DA3C0A